MKKKKYRLIELSDLIGHKKYFRFDWSFQSTPQRLVNVDLEMF